MYAKVPKTRSLSTFERNEFGSIGSLFGPFQMHVTTALACIRPRPWVYFGEPPEIDANAHKALESEAKYHDAKYHNHTEMATAP